MKGPTRKEDCLQKQNLRYDYSKDVNNKMKGGKTNIPITYDEAKASCKARKRKERQESISSLCQERKVIRSNSEERPTQKKYFDNNKSTIRRVSSSEDFQKTDTTTTRIISLTIFNETTNNQEKHCASNNKKYDKSSNQSTNDIILIYEDCEHERRRSHERFSKPLTLKSSSKRSHKSGRRPKARILSKTKFKPDPTHEISNNNNNNNNNNLCSKEQQQHNESNEKVVTNSENNHTEFASFLQLHDSDRKKERSPSPVRNIAPDIDLSTLHEQVDCSEPLLSCANHQINENTETMPGLSVASNRLLSSPRNSIIATHRIYLDKDIPQAFGLDGNGKPQNPLEIRLQKVTKQINSIKKKIKKYETEFENKYGYKVSHADKLNDKNIRQMYTDLNKYKKEQKQLMDVCPQPIGSDVEMESKATRNLQDTLNEIEKRLSQKRDTAKRTDVIEQMTSEELLDEKIAVQKALLYLESLHGRPNNKEDRNLVRPIYDRYRSLKRMLSKVQPSSTGNELATIHEDEQMNFITSLPAPVTELDSGRSSVLTSTDSDTDTSISENLHSLTKIELIEQHRFVFEEKKQLRRRIKMFEHEVQLKTGRMMQKEDRTPIEDVYAAYKKVRAKLKLLDALVGKQP